MMEEAFCMWSDLEKESDTTLYKYVHVRILYLYVVYSGCTFAYGLVL